MGGGNSKPLTNPAKPRTTLMPTSTVGSVSHLSVTTTRCSKAYTIYNLEHLILAFCVGILLTLLLLGLVFLIFKSYRKCHCHSQTQESQLDPYSEIPAKEPQLDPYSEIPAKEPQLDPYSEIPAKLSSPEEALTYASMTFESSGKKSPYLTINPSEDSASVVYSQVKE